MKVINTHHGMASFVIVAISFWLSFATPQVAAEVSEAKPVKDLESMIKDETEKMRLACKDKRSCSTIHLVKFEDVNGNGVQDAGEPLLSGWTFILNGPNGIVQATTNEFGYAVIGQLHAGQHTVMEVAQPGWTQVTPSSGSYSITLSGSDTQGPFIFGNKMCTDNPPCGGICDDEDLCTIDTCDIATDTCVFEPVSCPAGEVCDSFTGECQDIQNVVPCVAVIDEWDNRDYSTSWATFRASYPQRPFCLLVPSSSGTVQTLPTGFDADTVNNPDGVDRTIVAVVNRDNGNTGSASNWFNACNLGSLSPASVQFIGLFIDTSGSMTLSTVSSSYAMFLDDLDNNGLVFDQVFNSAEQWIEPFLTTLSG